MDAFFDMEFSMGKDRCDVISLACVIRDDNQIIDQFYTLTKPTKKLHWTAKRITKLKDKDLVNAISLKEALTEFNTWINFYNVTNIYNIGNCDKKVLSICCNRDGTDYLLKPFEMLEDVQEKISASVLLDGKQHFKQISLQNLKYLYDIDGKVSHNSLDDAIDLLNVYNAFEKNKEINKDRLIELIKTKEEEKERREKIKEEKTKKFNSMSIKDKFKFMREVHKVYVTPDENNFLKINQLLNILDSNNFYRISKNNYCFGSINLSREFSKIIIECNKTIFKLTVSNIETNKMAYFEYDVDKNMKSIYILLKNMNCLKVK